MKKSSPISLFSFQDIITCLTGIMIVVVLVILLQLVDTVAQATRRNPLKPEYLALQKELKRLQEEKLSLQGKAGTPALQAVVYAEMSLPELRDALVQEQKKAQELDLRRQQQAKLLAAAILDMEKWQLRLSRLKQEMQALTKDERQILELQTRVAALQKKAEEIHLMIARKQKMLRFEFSGLNERKPILVECNQWGFRARIYPDGEIVKFGSEHTAGSRQIPDLIRWLSRQDRQRQYPVFLFREAALPFHNQLLMAIGRSDPGIQMGRELLGATEECFE